MRKIKLFLASSITDLHDDRIALGDFVRQLNEIYIEKGVYISLIKCEDYDNSIALAGKQSEYDREIEDCDLCIFLFYRTVGEYTVHELDVAYGAFSSAQRPKIVTYLRQDEKTRALSEALSVIIKRLDGEYHHYYNVYAHIDTLKLGVLMQLKLMKLDSEGELDIKDGMLSLGGKDILSTANIPIFSNNEELSSLYAERKRLEGVLAERRRRYLEERTDEAEREFFAAAGEVSRVASRLSVLEDESLALVSSVAELASDGRVLTKRQKLALEFFNTGDYKRAQAVLDDEARETELEIAERRIESARREVEGYVEENELWIKAQRARGVNAEAFAKICEKYKRSAELCKKHRLDMTVIYNYAYFLYDNGRIAEAIRVASSLTRLLDENDKDELRLLIKVTDLLCALWCESRSFKNSLRMCEESQRLGELDSVTECDRLWDVARSNLSFSNMYGSFDDFENCLKHSYMSIEAYKKLAKDYGYKLSSDIAIVALNLGRAYMGLGRRNDAVLVFIDAIRTLKPEYERDFGTYAPILGKLFNNLSLCYYEMGDGKNARTHGEFALKIFLALDKKHPETTRPLLAVAYSNLGMILSMLNETQESERMLSEAIMLYEILIRESFDSYAAQLAVSYVNLSELYRRMLLLDKGVDAANRSIELIAELHLRNGEAYTPNLADAYNNLGAIHLQLDNYSEASEALHKARELYATLSQDKGGVFCDKLTVVDINIATCLTLQDNNDEAEESYLRVIDFFEKNPGYKGASFFTLAAAYYGMAMIRQEEGMFIPSLEFVDKAIDLYDGLCKDNPEMYCMNLADAKYLKGLLYFEEELLYDAIPYFEDAERLYNELKRTNPLGAGGKLIALYNEFAAAYAMCDASFRAEEKYKSAIEVAFSLLELGADAYICELSDMLYMMRNVYHTADERLTYRTVIEDCISRLDKIYGEDSELTREEKIKMRTYCE
ncbi:MAG: tetratricopeptide repeat protein [Clostridia bacterium]|nr:tetratricopeptide repeat protein [Clostridia bacterium]